VSWRWRNFSVAKLRDDRRLEKDFEDLHEDLQDIGVLYHRGDLLSLQHGLVGCGLYLFYHCHHYQCGVGHISPLLYHYLIYSISHRYGDYTPDNGGPELFYLRLISHSREIVHCILCLFWPSFYLCSDEFLCDINH
jgi:hypothetical protein